MRKYQLSQHFLRSPRLALMLVGHSNIKKRDLVLEIGAGSGVITSALAKRCRAVIAVEPDHQTADKLRQNLQRQGIIVRDYHELITNHFVLPDDITVYLAEADFLELPLPECQYKVFANPPFHLSSQIVHKLIESHTPPESFYLILQKQFALKLLLTDRHYTSQLGQQLTQTYQTKIKYPLRPTDFTPPPAVPTVLFEAKQIPVI